MKKLLALFLAFVVAVMAAPTTPINNVVIQNGGTAITGIPQANGTSAVTDSHLDASTAANVTTLKTETGNALTLATLDTNQPVKLSPNGTGAINFHQGLDLEYTGTPLYPFLITNIGPAINSGVATSPGRATYYPIDGVSLGSFNYSDSSDPVFNTTTGTGIVTLKFWNLVQATSISMGGGSLTSMSCPVLVQVQDLTISNSPVITTIDFPVLTVASGNFSSATLAALTTLSFPELLYVKQTFQPSAMALLTTFSFPKLKAMGGSFNPGTFAVLTNMTLPEMLNIGSNFTPNTMALLTTLSFPKLVAVGGTFNPNTMAALTTISIPTLQYIGGAVTFNAMASLTTINLAGMVNYASTITATTGLGAVSTVTLGTIGTLKVVSGATVNLSTQALSQASVDGILNLLASLDGTNGTTSFGTGKTVTLNGGTNANPTTTGTTTTTPAGSSFVGVGTTCTATIVSHGLNTGDIITVTGITTLTNANVTAATVTRLTANTFTYTIVSQSATGGGTASMHSTPSNGTDGFHACQVIRLRGATVTTALGF